MTAFGVSPSELGRTAGDLREIEAEASTRLTVLRRDVQEVLSAQWRGPAATGFGRGWSEWEAGARECLAALATMAQLLETTGQNYAAREQQNTTGITSAGRSLTSLA